MSKRTGLVLATTAALLAGGATLALADDGPGRRDDSPARTASPAAAAAPAAAARRLTVAQAIARARKAVPGKVESAELNRRLVWEIDLLTPRGAWRDLRIDAATGRIVRNRADKDDADDARELRAAKVSAAAAASRALKRVPGTVTSVELDDDAGDRPVWKVRIRTESGSSRTVRVASGAPRGAHDADDDHGGRNDHGRDDD